MDLIETFNHVFVGLNCIMLVIQLIIQLWIISNIQSQMQRQSFMISLV